MPITAFTTSFTPVTTGGTVAATGVTTAATAYDWFAPTGSGALATSIAAMSTSTAAGIQNKAFVQSIAQLAKTALLPLVKAELFATAIADPKTAIGNSIDSASNALASIQLSGIDTATKTALATAYNAEVATITAMLNRIKTLENKIYLVGDSIDAPASTGTGNIATAYPATANLTNFTGTKTYLSSMFDPAVLGNSGTAIPGLTATTFANASTLAGIYTTAATALTGATVIANLNALVEMSAKNIFDNYAIDIQGYSSAGTTGKWATGSAPVGIVPGIDYEVHLTGAYQTGVAAAGTAGAPSAVTAFW
ncbi:MAG: hypothetical protein ACK4OM_05130 [Alphaproteobacteria bacterium]